jgi:hypothetical protein
VADILNHRVQYFTPTGSFLGKFGTQGSGKGEFDRVIDVALSPSEHWVYATDRLNHRVQYFGWCEPAVAPTSLGKVKALFR